MNKYLEVDCRDIELLQDGDEIVVRFKGKVRADLRNRGGKVRLVNQQLLGDKNNTYAQMFKSKVVEPTPPPPQQVEKKPEEEKKKGQSPKEEKKEERERNIFGGNATNERQPQTASRPINPFNPRETSSSTSGVFGREPERPARDERPGWQNSNVFSSSRQDGGRQQNSFSSNNYSGSSYQGQRRESRDNRPGLADNIFMAGSSQPNNPHPSLFGASVSDNSNSSYNSRPAPKVNRNSRYAKQRIA